VHVSVFVAIAWTTTGSTNNFKLTDLRAEVGAEPSIGTFSRPYDGSKRQIENETVRMTV
jgi:hypothetical protein